MDVFSRTMQIPTEFYFEKAIKMKGINVARMATDYLTLTAQTEENQRKGAGSLCCRAVLPLSGFV